MKIRLGAAFARERTKAVLGYGGWSCEGCSVHEPRSRYQSLRYIGRSGRWSGTNPRLSAHMLRCVPRCREDAVVSEIRAAVKGIDPSLAVADVHTMSELVSQVTARRRFQTSLLTVFSGVAMLLAMVGVYGLLSYSVRQRTGEIGIRVALGSSKNQVMRLILLQGLTLLGVGLVIGLAGALACTRLLAGFLYGVPALDPATFAVVPMLLLVSTIAACLIPSVRAAAVDPMNSLRRE